MKKTSRFITALTLCFISLLSICTMPSSAAYSHPQALWQYFDRWSLALEEKDYPTILELAPTIEALYEGEDMNMDNASLLSVLCENAARGCELRGELEKAVVWLNKQLAYDEFLNKNGRDYTDRIIITKALIRQLDITTEIYAAVSNPADVPYFGAPGEPKAGVLQGSVSGAVQEPESGIIQTGESAILVYIEFDPDNTEHTLQYWLEYYTNNEKGQKAMSGNAVIELAWNFPKEADQLSAINEGKNDGYIIESIKYLSSLNTTVLLRVGAEMNVWTKLPDEGQYIAAFKRISELVRKNSNNVALVFSPNDVSSWGKSYKDYYPGDAYVDWIGVSTYYTGEPSKGSYQNDAFYTLGDYSANPLARLKLLAETFPNKPFVISECGFAYKSPKTGDQTAAAVERLKRFYAFLPMQYPQVKAVLYFDNLVSDTGPHYHFSGSSALKNAYLNVIKGDAYLTSLGSPGKGFTKLSTVNEKLETLKLYTNALFPKNETAVCKYYLDGVQVKTVTEAPYLLELAVKELAAGTHTVKAEITCGNIARTVERQFTVGSDGTVKGGASAPVPALTALPSPQRVFVDGILTAFDAYNIGGNNYFKLRDLAYAFNGTNAQFEVSWDDANNAIRLTSGTAYTPVGGELTAGSGISKTPSPTSSKILLDGNEITLTAYNIDGNNYFKLRDLGQVFDFSVTWDEAENAIRINTSEGYSD